MSTMPADTDINVNAHANADAGADMTTPHVITHVTNRIGFIELNRSEALNALSLPMVRAIHAALDEWHDDENVIAVVVLSHGILCGNMRAFCAGGDVRVLHDAWRAGNHQGVEQFFIDEYRLDHAIFTYPKPYIALMNGVTMGGGMGISQGAAHTGGLRVVGCASRLAMPETRIGLFPDVGVSWFLARTPGALGRYMAVTGEAIGAADALRAGLADVCVDDETWPALVAQLQAHPFENGHAVVAFIRQQALHTHTDTVPGLQPLPLALIDLHFSQLDVPHILASLERAQQEGQADTHTGNGGNGSNGSDGDAAAAGNAWIAQTMDVLRDRSPLSMAVSLEVVRRAAGSSMSNCLRRDLGVARASFACGDVMEGVRARLIDKDNQPRWRIADITDVSASTLEQMFNSPWPADGHPLRDLRES
jgi:enoyl-CoA hydratase/carnithine racemase